MTYTVAHVYETRAGISVEITCNEQAEENKTLLFKPSFWLEEDTVDEERIDSLKATAELCCAVARAESLLASSDYSRRRLIVRLMHYNHEQSVCEAAADYMIDHAFINEEEQTLRITKFYCQRKHWGKKRIAAELMGRGYAWLDTGTVDSLTEASNFVRTIETLQGIIISAPEEIGYIKGWIDRDMLLQAAASYGKSPYGQHLKQVADGKFRY